jgi:spore maturation protein CgeB
MEDAFREIDFFDWYFFINSTCIEKGTDRGFNHISQLLHAVDTGAFYRTESTGKEFDICFVGNWSRKRQEYIESLLKVTGNIVVYGDKWFKKNIAKPAVRRCIRSKYIDGTGLVEAYNKSKIVLNITNWGPDGGSRRSGLNMRVLEVPATGSFLLTDGSIDMEKVVTPGKHVAVYEDVEECVRLAKYYLENASEREAIADAGYKHVRSHYTYDDIVRQIICKYNEVFEKC